MLCDLCNVLNLFKSGTVTRCHGDPEKERETVKTNPKAPTKQNCLHAVQTTRFGWLTIKPIGRTGGLRVISQFGGGLSPLTGPQLTRLARFRHTHLARFGCTRLARFSWTHVARSGIAGFQMFLCQKNRINVLSLQPDRDINTRWSGMLYGWSGPTLSSTQSVLEAQRSVQAKS